MSKDNLWMCIPVLRVADAQKSCEFYCGKLGFTESWDHRDAPDRPLFVSISRDGIDLFLTEHAESATGALVYFTVRDVEELYRKLLEQGVEVEQSPIDKPWGMREMQIRDPDGNRLRFGQTKA